MVTHAAPVMKGTYTKQSNSGDIEGAHHMRKALPSKGSVMGSFCCGCPACASNVQSAHRLLSKTKTYKKLMPKNKEEISCARRAAAKDGLHTTPDPFIRIRISIRIRTGGGLADPLVRIQIQIRISTEGNLLGHLGFPHPKM